MGEYFFSDVGEVEDFRKSRFRRHGRGIWMLGMILSADERYSIFMLLYLVGSGSGK